MASKNAAVSIGCGAHRVCLLRNATSVLAYETAPPGAVGDGSTQKGDGGPAPYHSLNPGRSLPLVYVASGAGSASFVLLWHAEERFIRCYPGAARSECSPRAAT